MKSQERKNYYHIGVFGEFPETDDTKINKLHTLLTQYPEAGSIIEKLPTPNGTILTLQITAGMKQRIERILPACPIPTTFRSTNLLQNFKNNV